MFKSNLKNTIHNETLNSANWKNESWKLIVPDINQEILNDAFNQHSKISELFKNVGEIIPRKCKQMGRIVKKTSEISNRGGEYFKIFSDFVAGRIHCNVNEIPVKLDIIKQVTKNHNGCYYIKGETTETPYGFCEKNGVFLDVTQYIYVYLEEIGYPIEFQIGHKFASLTFYIDSSLRDNKECGLTDLWTDNFYGMVKTYILNKANKKEPVSGGKYDICDTAFRIHKGILPDELKRILDGL